MSYKPRVWSDAKRIDLLEVIESTGMPQRAAAKWFKVSMYTLQRELGFARALCGGHWYTSTGAAKVFCVSRGMVRRWCDHGWMRAVRWQGTGPRRINQASIHDFLLCEAAWAEWEPASIEDKNLRDTAVAARVQKGLPHYLTTAQVAMRLGYSPAAVRRWVADDRIPHTHGMCGHTLIRQDQIPSLDVLNPPYKRDRMYSREEMAYIERWLPHKPAQQIARELGRTSITHVVRSLGGSYFARGKNVRKVVA